MTVVEPRFQPSSTQANWVPGLVAEWVRRTPDALALRDAVTGESLTYRQLWRRTGRLAAELAGSLGVGSGDVVAVATGRSVDFVVSALAITRAGAAYLPLDDHAPAQRVATILSEAGVDRAVCPRDPARQTPLPAGVRRLTAPGALPGNGEPGWLDVPVGRDDPCYVTYTSGSTGRPKGVVVPHRGVIRLVREPNYCVIEPGDRVANLANVAFDVTAFEIWASLTAGAAVVVMPPVTQLSLDGWLSLVGDQRLTTIFLTTSVFHLIARERPAAFAGVANVLVGGEQMDLPATVRVLTEGAPGRLVNGYGPTEVTVLITYFDCTLESLAGADRVPIGFPIQQTSVQVLDDELRPVAPGEAGELCAGGPGVALGYLNRPELTAQRFVRVGGEILYRTGDLVRERSDGALELVGRRDRQVKVRGFRVELEEIEIAAAATGLVGAAFVEKIGDGAQAALVGFALAPQARLDELAATLAERLPEYMLPSRWLALESVPLNPTGKVDREALLDLLDAPAGGAGFAGSAGGVGFAGSAGGAGSAGSAGGVAVLVTELWRELLCVAQVGPADNFLELGGNSLMAVQLAARLRERLGADVEPADVLLAGSLTELVEQIEDRSPP